MTEPNHSLGSGTPGPDYITPPPRLLPQAERVYAARPLAPPPAARDLRYPVMDMRRSAAALDIVAVFGLLLAVLISPTTAAVLMAVEAHAPSYGILLSNTLTGIVVLTVIAAILVLRRQPPASLGLNRPRPWHAVVGMASVPACYVVVFLTGIGYMLLSELTGGGIDDFLEDRSALIDMMPSFSIVSVLLFGAFTGLFEELVFRGVILTRCYALVRSRAAAVVLAGILFGLVHAYQGPLGIIQTAAIGIVLGITATLSHSLWPAIIGHAAFNSIQFAMMPFAAEAFDELSRQGAAIVP